jgi:hypothetical protein
MVRRIHVDHRRPSLDLLVVLFLERHPVGRRERLGVAEDLLDVAEPRDRPEALLGVGSGCQWTGVTLAELTEGPERDLLDEGVVARQVDLVQPNAHRGLLGCDAG